VASAGVGVSPMPRTTIGAVTVGVIGVGVNEGVTEGVTVGVDVAVGILTVTTTVTGTGVSVGITISPSSPKKQIETFCSMKALLSNWVRCVTGTPLSVSKVMIRSAAGVGVTVGVCVGVGVAVQERAVSLAKILVCVNCET
jgi:hypothetical protein